MDTVKLVLAGRERVSSEPTGGSIARRRETHSLPPPQVKGPGVSTGASRPSPPEGAATTD